MQDVCVSSYTQPAPDPLFLQPKTITKRPLNEIPSTFLANLLSVAVMALDRRVLKEGDILCELYVPMFLTIVKVNFWTVTVTVTVTSQKLVHINNFNRVL